MKISEKQKMKSEDCKYCKNAGSKDRLYETILLPFINKTHTYIGKWNLKPFFY